MKSFRTELPPIPPTFQIRHDHSLLALGSCFAVHIGQRLLDHKFKLCLNPFGIIYHPVALANNLRRIVEGRPYRQEALFCHEGIWHSWDHHSRFSHPDAALVVAQINSELDSARAHLAAENVLILSLGTAIGHRLRDNGNVVANCHKVPANFFETFRSSPAEIVEALGAALQLLQEANPDLQCLLTVSPVRHLRSGLIENQRSKAALLLAVEELTQSLPNTHYFPAYELLLDDLRDYRFFADDLLHPNAQAIDYIWDYFVQSYFSEPTQALNKRIQKLVTASQHQPFHPMANAHQHFLRKQLQQVTQLEKEYPGLDWREERERFERDLLV